MKGLIFVLGFIGLTPFSFARPELRSHIDVLNICPEIPPYYPGGLSAMKKFIAENIRYPENSKKGYAEGIVIVLFAIDTKGQVTDVKVVKSVSQELDQEAVRVIKLLRGWKPAIMCGKKVVHYLRQPITFVSEVEKVPQEASPMTTRRR